jgi:phage shock protein E
MKLGFIVLLFSFSIFANDFIGLDVRTQGELIRNPAIGAIHISISDLSKTTLKRVRKDKPIKIFCESGGRAGKALRILEANGYKNVENIGSWRDWNQLTNKTK